MSEERSFPLAEKVGRLRMMALAIMAGATVLTVSGVVAPRPALAWWRGGVWVGGPGYYPYYAPRPYYYAPPVVVAPPPVYYAPPPVYYPQPAPYPVAARTCYAAALSCPMEVARAPGSTCYCSDATGSRSYGTAH